MSHPPAAPPLDGHCCTELWRGVGARSPRVGLGLTGSGLPSARRGVGWPREGAHRVDRDGGHLWDTSLVPTPSHLRGTGRCTSPPSLGQSGYWGHTDGQCQSWLSRFPGPTWVSCPLTAFPCAYPSFPLREDCRWTELLESLTPLLAKCIHHCRLPPSISRTFPDLAGGLAIPEDSLRGFSIA